MSTDTRSLQNDPVAIMTARAILARERIRPYIYETPLIPARRVGHEVDAHILWKAENFQLTGSFKIRGATAKMTASKKQANHSADQTAMKPHLLDEQPQDEGRTFQDSTPRLITASSGNHGIGSSQASSLLHLPLTVVLPETVSPAKLAKIKSFASVSVILHGEETGQAEVYAQSLAAKDSYEYISPYNDLDVISGQATIGLEIIDQFSPPDSSSSSSASHKPDLTASLITLQSEEEEEEDVTRSEQQTQSPSIDHVFISMGGGGLISGIGSVIKTFSPQTKIWGVAARNSMALAASIKAGRVVETEHLTTLAEAVAGGMDEDAITLDFATRVVDEVVECDEGEIVAALQRIAFEENMIVEGSAALALAGWERVKERVRGQTSIIILCGANVDQDMVRKVIYGQS